MKKIKFNVPTKLTFVRLILSLIIIILLIFPFYRVGITFPQFLFKNILIDLRYLISGVLFIIASITDYYDGKLARKNNEVTNFGKLVDAIRMICANNGKVQAAKLSGKIKTATLMIGIILTFFYNLPFQIWGYRVSDFFLYFGTIMSIVSMCEYYYLNKKMIFLEFEEK